LAEVVAGLHGLGEKSLPMVAGKWAWKFFSAPTAQKIFLVYSYVLSTAW
jgi:hypothetical protein